MTDRISGNYRRACIEKLVGFFKVTCGDNAERIAKEAIDNFGSVDKLFATPYEVLCEMWDKSTALLVRVAAAANARRETERFEFSKSKTEAEICSYFMGAFLDECVESVKVMPLDEESRPILCKTVSKGTVNASEIAVRAVAETAYSCGSKRVIIAHNHPRGIAIASQADLEMTQSIARALLSIGIRLDYHVIVSGSECDVLYPDEALDEGHEG